MGLQRDSELVDATRRLDAVPPRVTSVRRTERDPKIDIAEAVAAAGRIHAQQPYRYRAPELVERSWRRLPGFADVSPAEWESATWQRRNTARNVAALQRVFGKFLDERLARSIERDQAERATMSLSIPPHMLNTMDEHDLWRDPVRRYMVPAFADRDPTFPSHPAAQRDSLHEADMFAVPGLVHRYPTKALLELTTTCPQYCGHCTRMDLVGHDVPQVAKLHLGGTRESRHNAALAYLRSVPWVRDVVVSGGDIADVPIAYLESFLLQLFAIDHVRTVRLATKALIGIPQYFLQRHVRDALDRIATVAHERELELAVHVHVNTARSLTPAVAAATRALREAGIHHIRNQGVLLAGVNNRLEDLLDLCYGLLDTCQIAPYYFYMCDLIPNSEHWRVPLREAQELQDAMMGYLPGFATPRIVCDVPGAGKHLVHQAIAYDRVTGISKWKKNYLTKVDSAIADGPAAIDEYFYYDPVRSLPSEGQEYWHAFVAPPEADKSFVTS